MPEHLPREVVTHPVPDACPACGGDLRPLGEDVTEVLDWVPGRFRVVRHVRPKCSCRRCEAISPAAAPSLPILRGRAGAGLLAHVLVSKYADHLPLYRQAEILAREGVVLSRSTLADWVGQCAALLRPLVVIASSQQSDLLPPNRIATSSSMQPAKGGKSPIGAAVLPIGLARCGQRGCCLRRR